MGYSSDESSEGDSSESEESVTSKSGDDNENDKSSEEGSSESEESITSKSDDDNENVNLKVEEFILPDTVEGIQDRFNELYVEFVRKGKHENRNELEFLLD